MDPLVSKKCQPCEGSTPPLQESKIQEYLPKVPGWILDSGQKQITRRYTAKNFMVAVDFINRVAMIAEAENHHPDIHLTRYRQLEIILSTHAIGGLSENDFILAAKINELPIQLKV